MRNRVLALLVGLVLAFAASSRSAVAQATGGFGVMGDSGSDEYRADDNRGGTYAATTLNWVELLVRYRGLDAGVWGTRGEPRRTGYEHNWARSMARAADVISQGQADGLAQQVAEGKVSWALLMVGANDFAVWNNTYEAVYSGAVSGAALTAKIDGIVASIAQALDIVRIAGPVQLLVANRPPPQVTPSFQAQFPDPAGRQRVTDAIADVNDGIANVAVQRGIPVVDLDGLATAVLSSQVDANGNLDIEGELINLLFPGDEPHHGLLGDNDHAGTVLGGILANYILDHLAAAGGPNVPRFTDQELLNNAGIFPVVPDTTPPTVSMALPLAGTAVSGSVTISANAADNRGVFGVQFQVDGANLGSEDTTPPYSRTWNATNAAPGAHVLTAIARDAAGNVAVAQVTVTVVDATPPTVTLTSPTSGSQVSGTVAIQASASDNVGVAGVTFYWNGTALGPETAAAPYRFTVATNPSHNGTVTLMAVARDTSGNTRSSSPVTITVNNPVPDTTNPTVAFTAPANNATVSNTVTVTASASDNVSVTGVQFKLDGNNLGAEDTVAPYAVSWNTTTATSGPHSLTATARDAAGNTTTATLTVNILLPQTLYPASYAVVSGAYQSGDLQSLVADDNNHLVVRSSTSGLRADGAHGIRLQRRCRSRHPSRRERDPQVERVQHQRPHLRLRRRRRVPGSS